MLKLSILCTRFEVIIVVVQVGSVRIHEAAVEALKKKGKSRSNQDETLSIRPTTWVLEHGRELLEFRVT